MTDEQFDRLESAIVEHGDQLGRHLARLKGFLQAERRAQEEFLVAQREASERAQVRAHKAARFSAAAAIAAAIAAITQALDAILT